jgi:hypothetical protein
MKVWTNGTDTVIAPDIEAVGAILRSHYGSDEFDDELDGFNVVPSDRPIRIHNFNGHGHDDVTEKTAGEWATSEGAGFLCSTEW